MSHTDAPKPELSSPALSQQIGSNSISSEPRLESAHDAIDLYTSAQDQSLERTQGATDRRSPVVRTEIRLGSLDVSESLSRLAEVLKIDAPQADPSENEPDCDVQCRQPDDLPLATDHPVQIPNQTPNQTVDDSSDSLSHLLLGDVEAYGAIHDLHQQNQDVLDQILQLETLLTDYQAILSAQPQPLTSSPAPVPSLGMAAPSQDSLGDMTPAQTQALQLMTELEVANQVSQHQQSLIELLAAELHASRSQLADLEQQYIQVRQQAEEKTKLLSDQEVTCSDLRSRLHRQQRYTLQFKAALEKCLEMSAAGADGELPIDTLQDDLDTIVITPVITPQDSANHETATLRSQVFLPKMKPIQPWSQSPALFGEEIAAEPERHPVDRYRDGSPDQDAHGSEWLWFVNDGDEPPIRQEPSIFATVTPIEVDASSMPSQSASSSFSSAAIGHAALSDAGVIDVASEAPEKPLDNPPSISFDLRRRKSPSVEEEALPTPSLPGLKSEAAELERSDLASLQPVMAELANLEQELATIHRAMDALAAEPEEMPIADIFPTLAKSPDGAVLNGDVTLPGAHVHQPEPASTGGASLEALAALTPHHNLEVDIWEDLARVINAPSAVTIVNSSLLQMRGLSTNPVPTAAEQSVPSTELNTELNTESMLSLEQAPQAVIQQPATLSASSPVSPASALPVSNGLGTPETNNEQPIVEQPIVEQVSQNGVEAEVPFQIHPTWPSPTVYADRPLKKRTSLAAVELPSFPRLRQQ